MGPTIWVLGCTVDEGTIILPSCGADSRSTSHRILHLDYIAILCRPRCEHPCLIRYSYRVGLGVYGFHMEKHLPNRIWTRQVLLSVSKHTLNRFGPLRIMFLILLVPEGSVVMSECTFYLNCHNPYQLIMTRSLSE